MASERLSHVLQTFASALAEANEELAAQHDERVSYVITELDAALTYGRLELGERGAMVDLEDRGQEGSGRVIRLRISPVPVPAKEEEPEVPEGRPDPRNPKDIKGLHLEEGLRAIALAGLPTDQVVIAFDPGSDKAEGEILDYAVERDGTSGTPRFVFTVAGRPPKGGTVGGRLGGRFGGLLGGGVLGGRPGGDVRPPRR